MVARSGSSGRAQLVHLNELLGGVIELDEKNGEGTALLKRQPPCILLSTSEPWSEFSLRE